MPRTALRPYDTTFYKGQLADSARSAAKIAPLVAEVLKPTSVVDVGGGVGPWTRAFLELGVTDVLCVDGDYVDRDLLLVPPDRFVARDLTKPLRLDRRFDLALSLEVAEHLPVESAEGFIDQLVGLAPAVLFSAAIPKQGGVDHVNERWQSYWLEIFGRHGYTAIDIVRPKVWEDHEVMSWYAQNTLLYVAPELAETLSTSRSGYPVDVVSPRFYEYQRLFIDAIPPPLDAARVLLQSLKIAGRAGASHVWHRTRRRLS